MVLDIRMETKQGGITISPEAFFKSVNCCMLNLNHIAKMAIYSDEQLGYDCAVTAWKDATKEQIGIYQKMQYTDEELKRYSPKEQRSMRAKNRKIQKRIDDLLKFIIRLEEKK